MFTKNTAIVSTVVVCLLLVGIAVSTRTQQDPLPYRNINELEANDPQMFERLKQESRNANNIKRARQYAERIGYKPPNPPKQSAVKNANKEVPLDFLLRSLSANIDSIKLNARHDLYSGSNVVLALDTKPTIRYSISWTEYDDRDYRPEDVRRAGPACPGKPTEMDAWGIAGSTVGHEPSNGSADFSTRRDRCKATVRIYAEFNESVGTFTTRFDEQQIMQLYEMLRYVLAYRVAALSTKTEQGQEFRGSNGPVKFRAIKTMNNWRLSTAHQYARTYDVQGNKIELVAGAKRAKLNGQFVQLKQIIAANDDDWFIADENISLLTQ